MIPQRHAKPRLIQDAHATNHFGTPEKGCALLAHDIFAEGIMPS
jgi:hypothetical protein